MTIQPNKDFFGSLDKVVMNAIIQCLPPETLGTNAVVSKFFLKKMDDPVVWKQIATKLNVVPKQNETFKAAAITRLKANAYAMQIFPQFLKDKIGKIENPLILNQRIKEEVAFALSPEYETTGLLLIAFKKLLADISSSAKPMEVAISAVQMLLEDAQIMSGASYHSWRELFTKGLSLDNKKSSLDIPKQQILFKLLAFGIKKSSLPEEDQDRMIRSVLTSMTSDPRIPQDIRDEYLKVALEAGMSPRVYLDRLLTTYTYTNPNWITENIDELQFYFQYASSDLKTYVIAQLNEVNFLLDDIRTFSKALFTPAKTLTTEEIKGLINRYLDVPQFITSVEGKPFVPDPAERKNRIAQIQKRIDEVIKEYEEGYKKDGDTAIEINLSILRGLIPKE